MDRCDFLLIGGGVAAYNAAKRIRRADPDGVVMMITADPLPPYDLPPLSKEFLRGEKVESELIYPALESIGLQPIEIVRSETISHIDPTRRTARLATGREINFEQALLATGASPIRLLAPGADLPEVFYLRSAQDCRRIASAAKSGSRAVVIGAGFIGLEVAASLCQMGVSVTVIEAAARIWPRFADQTMAQFVQAACEARGVRFLTGELVVGIDGEDRVRSVVTASGQHLECDFVCVGVGIRPNIELAQTAGLEVRDGVVVDSMMRTSAPHIFAAGDAVNYPDPVRGANIRAEHWGHAEYSGQLAGRNMTGATAHYDFMNYAWTDIFDLNIQSAGHLDEYDEVVIRGSLEDRRFTALYLNDGALVAYCAVNAEPVEFVTFRKLIRNRQDLGPSIEGLRNAGLAIRSLLQA